MNKEDYFKSGVYKITNLIDNKFYIGSSKTLYTRFKQHCYTLLNAKSGNIILQRAVIKYGIVNFEFSIIEITDNYREQEIYYTNLLQPEYNIIKELDGNKRIISEDTRKRMSNAQKGRVAPNKGKTGGSYNRIKKKKIKSIDKEGNELIHNDIHAVISHFNFGQSSIYQCCKGQRNNVYGIIFQYV